MRPLGWIVLVVLASACGARTGLREARGNDASVAARDAGIGATARDAFVRDAPIEVVRRDAIVSPDAFVPSDAFVSHDAFAAPDVFALDAGEPCVLDARPLAGAICERLLDARDAILSCPGGFVDVVARGAGTLRWECEGRRAEAVFAGGVYRGTRTGDAFALCIRTEFDYVDGCRWESSQRIDGAASSGVLALTYTEAPLVSDGDCFPPCTAEASISVP